MSEQRLDAATLRAAAGYHEGCAQWELTHDAASDYDDALSCAKMSTHRSAAAHFNRLAAEAEARPADLADWIAAATRSKLGEPPQWRAGPTLYWPFLCKQRVFVDLDTDRPVNARVRCGDVDIICTTPAELRAALDALATEAGR